jgi:type I restriction enzyme M protein
LIRTKNTHKIKYLRFKKIDQVKIPLPPLDIQRQIVSRIEEEQQMVDATKKLIQLYQGKIKEKIDEVWGA